MVSKLDVNHLLTTWEAELNFEASVSGLSSVTNILVSSAKRMGVEILSKAKGRSLIYNRNNTGPKTEPCGTPCCI
jgi:hypothetical protein